MSSRLAFFAVSLAVGAVVLGIAGPGGPLARDARAATVIPGCDLPDPRGRAEQIDLFLDLLSAPDEASGRAIEDEIWRSWFIAPTPQARALLDAVQDRRRWMDLEAALDAAERLTRVCPAYPEGWNQRATTLFLLDRNEEALEMVDRVLALEPRHFGALSGQALALMRLGRHAEAQEALRRAVAIHPWLRERDMLRPDAETPTPETNPETPGEDL
jgi:tetratricopeptide (TPR) repeat protein